MMHIHPFPARMAPEIALDHLKTLSSHATVLDPMCGSGMVLNQAARVGIRSIGCDLDPLARLISQVDSTRVRVSAVWDYFDKLMTYCKRNNDAIAKLGWIDNDIETKNFVAYWFGNNQEKQLRRISKFLIKTNSGFASNPKNIIAIALSRLIISKEPKASLARDTAHSRPHKIINTNNFNIYGNLESSVQHVLKALQASEIKINSKIYVADARRLSRLSRSSVDAIITSPPYLNAIDYMRGHKFSLIWFGYNLAALRSIRSIAIGSETFPQSGEEAEFKDLLGALELNGLKNPTRSMLSRYYIDIKKQLTESRRVLKRGKLALFVIGNSSIRGDYIRNNEILKFAANKVGFIIKNETTRKIPNNKRYLPITVTESNSLSGRIRTEHVIELTA